VTAPPAIYIDTSGCAFNISDGEAMAGLLRREGYRIVDDETEADLVILNTCTVKDRTFREFEKRWVSLRRAAGAARPVVLAGCIPKAYERLGRFDGAAAVGPASLSKLPEVVAGALQGRPLRRLAAADGEARPRLPLLRRNPCVHILPIARGCRSACAFCQTRLARGRLASFSPRDLLDQARRALDEGVVEIWVTAQDTGAYGHDLGTTLPELLGRLLDLSGEFKVRLGMSSPRWVREARDAYLDLLAHPKMFRFLHVPVQSGSERVVRRMRRDGSVEDFLAIHEAFARRFPEGTLLTDLIVGYPTETESDFQATLDLVQRLRLPGINCSRFSPRPGTPAAALPQLPPSVVAARSRLLTASVRRISGEVHQAWVGRNCWALVDQRRADGRAIARTDAYRPVLVLGEVPLGRPVLLEIVRGEPFRFVGRPIRPVYS